MRERAGYVNDISHLGRAYTRGHDLPIGWKAEAACSRDRAPAVPAGGRKGGTPSIWLVDPQERYLFGDTTVRGDQLTEVALGECSMCPVQWDCASFAVMADEPWGTWGMLLDDLEWLKRQTFAETLIRNAEVRGQPVQFAVASQRRQNLVGLLA